MNDRKQESHRMDQPRQDAIDELIKTLKGALTSKRLAMAFSSKARAGHQE